MPDFLYEQQYTPVIVGVDEAGRGPWAGPVVAAAVNLYGQEGRAEEWFKLLNDSKKLSATKRELLYDNILSAYDYGVGIVGVEDIDRYNILGATKMAMQDAVGQLVTKPKMVLVDGNQLPELPCEARAIVKGDAKSLSIAAASIVAKVTRDRIMCELHQEFPHYAWDRNAGYGTKLHQEGLAKFGVTQHHRKSYAPIKKLLGLI